MAIYVWPLAVDYVVHTFNVSAHSINMVSIGVLIVLVCVGMFLASRSFPNEPNNNSLCNTRQVLTWTSYCTTIVLGFYLLHYINFPTFRYTMLVIFFITEMLSVVFRFYDPPYIYHFTVLFEKPKRSV